MHKDWQLPVLCKDKENASRCCKQSHMCICVCMCINSCSDCQDCQEMPETICLGLARAHVCRSIGGDSNKGKEGCDKESAVKYFSRMHLADSSARK